MPYIPKDADDEIVLTLRSGDTVKLHERSVSVQERKELQKRALNLQFEYQFKAKQATKLSKTLDADEPEETEYKEAQDQAVELFSTIDMIGVHAQVFEWRFDDWDVYASQADYEAGHPVELKKDAILEFASLRKANAQLITEIADLLKRHDEEVAEKNALGPTSSGRPSTTTPTIQ